MQVIWRFGQTPPSYEGTLTFWANPLLPLKRYIIERFPMAFGSLVSYHLCLIETLKITKHKISVQRLIKIPYGDSGLREPMLLSKFNGHWFKLQNFLIQQVCNACRKFNTFTNSYWRFLPMSVSRKASRKWIRYFQQFLMYCSSAFSKFPMNCLIMGFVLTM